MNLRALVLFTLAACSAIQAQFTVAAAANVKPAMEEIITAFRKATGQTVKATYGSSGKFATQIRAGAPFDLFVAADVSFPDSVVKWGLGIGKPVVYARGIVVLWTSIADLDPSAGPSILLDPRIVKVAIADPRLAPYGRSTVVALTKAGRMDALRSKVVWGENIGQVATYAATGAVEAAFPAKSHAVANLANKGRWAELDSALVEPIDQAAVVLKYGKENNPKLSQAFLDFLTSPYARAVWAKFGYKLP